ncbi:hypothetical protein C0Q70_13908 [Pomacea canaliculata]|uniref:Cystatin domain-containing protein n=1 Tax=Pomacea canaliculata TaxID=400727 RepID=A0A2T7NYI2_POMCA|nr:uncharacterized protein LOC112570152 [Pomacea canaliculata]PVD26238.1 hypothetical protein C0Q70_13908 [Pomacea canaliculata]
MTGLLLILLPAMAAPLFLGGGVAYTYLRLTDEPVVFAVQAINEQFKAKGDTTPRQLAEIVDANEQVVAGEKFYLTLRLTGDEQDDYCKVEVWFSEWLTGADRLVIVDGPSCSKSLSRRQLDGGISDPIVLGTSPDREVTAALNFAVCAFNDRCNCASLSVLGDTSRVTYTQQVTSGTTYRFYKVPLLTSSCTKQANSCRDTDLSTCAVSSDATTTTCDLTVQYQPWRTLAYTLPTMTCH